MYSNSKKLLFFALSAVLLSSCVAEKRFQDEVSARAKAEEERARLKSDNIDLNATNADLVDKMKNYDRQLEHLRKDTAVMATSLNRMTTNYDKLNDTYERLLDQMGKLREGNAEDTKRLSRELQDARKEVQAREDQLHKLELALANREGNLDAMRSELDKSKKELEDKRIQLMARSKRISDLEGVLASKDSAVMALRNNIANALLGFADEGLTVEQKNGKVYVSLEEQLLLRTGS